MEEARALLNGLMGAARNEKGSKSAMRRYTDSDICRNFLLGLCPNDLFRNTKIDLGFCPKYHGDEMREMFEGDKDYEFYRRKWRKGLRDQLKMLMDSVDRRIDANNQRLQRELDSGFKLGLDGKKELARLKDEMSDKLNRAEEAASEGNVQESRRIMQAADTLKAQIEEMEYKPFEGKAKDVVCPICGLIADEEELELMKQGRGHHTNGKQHQGYILIRKTLKELDAQQEKDRKNGLRTPSPSPIKKVSKNESRGGNSTRKRSPDRDDTGTRGRRVSASRSRDRNRGNRGSKTDDRRRGGRSPSRNRKKDALGRDLAARNIKRRSPSRRRSRSNKRRDRSASRKKTSSPPKKEKSPSPVKEPPQKRAASPEAKGSRGKDSKEDAAPPPKEAPKSPEPKAPVEPPAPEKPASSSSSEEEALEPLPPLPKVPVRFFLGFKKGDMK